MIDDKTGACRRCKAACYVWQVFCGAACSVRWECGDRSVEGSGVLSMASIKAERSPTTGRRTSQVFCEHANECPRVCPCDELCRCKDYSCKEQL